MPFLAIAAAFFIFNVLLPKAKGRLRMASILGLAAALIVPTAAKSVKADLLFSGMDTRVTSAGWIEDNIPPGTRIAVDHTAFRPVIPQTKEQIAQKREITGYQEGLREQKEKKIGYLLEAIQGKKTYNVYFLTYKREIRGQFLSTVPALSYDLDALKENGIRYVVINYNTFNEEKKDFVDQLKKEAEVIAEFSPYDDGKIRYPYDTVDATFMAIGSKELFSRRMTGPCLVLYKIRSDRS